MATLIDALVVTLGLDANHFRNEAEKIKKENKKLSEEQERQVERLAFNMNTYTFDSGMS